MRGLENGNFFMDTSHAGSTRLALVANSKPSETFDLIVRTKRRHPHVCKGFSVFSLIYAKKPTLDRISSQTT